MAAAGQAADARDPRPAARATTGGRATSPTAHPIDELVLTVLSQNTNDRNRDVAYAAAARALPELGGGARRAGRGGRGGDPARAASQGEGAADPGDPRASSARRDLDLDWLGTAPREERIDFLHVAARRRAQNRRLRADLLLGHAGDPGRHPRPPGRRAARACSARRPPSSAPTTRCWRSSTREDAYELHVNLIRHGRRLCAGAAAAVRAVPAPAPVPLRARARGPGEPRKTSAIIRLRFCAFRVEGLPPEPGEGLHPEFFSRR